MTDTELIDTLAACEKEAVVVTIQKNHLAHEWAEWQVVIKNEFSSGPMSRQISSGGSSLRKVLEEATRQWQEEIVLRTTEKLKS